MVDKVISMITKTSGKSEVPTTRDKSYSNLDGTEISVGKRLREIRTLRGLSMRMLAKMSGLNINTLSLIENEHTSPSVSTLQQLAQSLHINISEFFEGNPQSKKVVHQHNGKRPCISFANNKIEDLAAGLPRFGIEPIIVSLSPNTGSGRNPIVHTGREFVYCLEGHVSYTVDEEKYLLEPGDSLLFEAYLPHHWRNVDVTPSRILLVLCPMDERDQPKDRHFIR
jgi:transcriptional regulator with XRE-family HTH domain